MTFSGENREAPREALQRPSGLVGDDVCNLEHEVLTSEFAFKSVAPTFLLLARTVACAVIEHADKKEHT